MKQVNFLSAILFILMSNASLGQVLIDSINSNNTLYGIDISKDGSHIFLAGKDSTVTIYNQEQESMILKGHKSSVSSVDYFDKTGTILTGSYDNTAILWDMNGNRLTTLKHEKAVIKVSQSDQFLATASRDNSAGIWKRDGELLFFLSGHSSQVNDIQFIDEKRWIVTASFDNSIKIWNYEGELLKSHEVHASGIRSIQVFTENKLIISGHRDGILVFVSFDGTILRKIQAHGLRNEEYKMVNSIQLLQDDKVVSAGADGYIRVWDLDGKMINEVFAAPKEQAYISGLAISKSIMVSSSGGKNPMMKVWQIPPSQKE